MEVKVLPPAALIIQFGSLCLPFFFPFFSGLSLSLSLSQFLLSFSDVFIFMDSLRYWSYLSDIAGVDDFIFEIWASGW